MNEYHSELSQLKDYFWKLLFSHASVKHMVNEAARKIDNPVFLINANMKLIANSGEISGDIVWDTLLQEGYLSSNNIHLAKTEARYQPLYNNDLPLYIKINMESDNPAFTGVHQTIETNKSELKYARLITKIQNRGTLLGFLVILEEKPLKTYCIEFAEFISEILATQFQLMGGSVISRNPEYSFFLTDLINGSLSNPVKIEERMAILRHSPHTYKYILAVGYKKDSNNTNELLYLESVFSGILNHFFCTVYENHLIYLCSTDHFQPFNPQNHEKLTSVLEENNLYIGISFLYRKLENTPVFYQQALAALNLCAREDNPARIGSYEYYGPENVILDLGRSETSLIKYIHPVILEIISHDLHYHTEYFKTLYYILEYPGNMKSVAVELCINRNSLSYRIEKIENSFGIDLKQNRTLQQLYISFTILKLFITSNPKDNLQEIFDQLSVL